MARKIIELISTFFYVGYLPHAPGTYASFIAALIYCLIKSDPVFFYSITLILTAAGFFVCGKAEKFFQKKDPSRVVIDEVCGMLLTYIGIKFSLITLAAGFLFFRLFDITKPFPANKVQNLNGSAGIMLDDLIAALYANLLLRLMVLIMPCCVK